MWVRGRRSGSDPSSRAPRGSVTLALPGGLLSTILVLSLLLAAINIGMRLPGLRQLDQFPTASVLGYEAEGFRGIAPLRPSFVDAVLGSRADGRELSPIPESRPKQRGIAVVSGLKNDKFEDAAVIESLPYRAEGDASSATLQAGEPNACSARTLYNSLWFRYTPPTAQTLAADTLASNYDTILSVHVGTRLDELELQDCNDNDEFTKQSRVVFAASKGRTYYFQIGSGGITAGLMVFSLEVISSASNDDFANARYIENLPYQDRRDTTRATIELGEPQPSCLSTKKSVWYRHTSRTTRLAVVDTSGSSFSTVVAVYAGNRMDRLSEVGCDAFNRTGSQSRVPFSMTAGRTYYIQVGGFQLSSGQLDLTLSFITRPSNDDFESALVIRSVPHEEKTNNTLATVQVSEPVPACAPTVRGTIWYVFGSAAESTRELAVDASGSSVSAVIAVYARMDSGEFVSLACSSGDAGSASVVVPIVSGRLYYVQVGGVEPPYAGELVVNFRRIALA